MHSQIKQAVIPAAGLGSRFLPVTKVVPKELIPLLDRPSLQYVIDEAVTAGVEEFVIVVSEEKRMLEDYFAENAPLHNWLAKRGLNELDEQLRQIQTKAKFRFVIQKEPLGLGHAVLCANRHITADYFFVLLPDDIIDATVGVCRQMLDVFARTKLPLVTVKEVPWDEVRRYGMVKAQPLSKNLGDVKDIVEKPSRDEAPSNLAVIGRYLLPKDIFFILEKTGPGVGGEIQLTDALKEIAVTRGLNSYLFAGEHFDTGTPLGWLKANVSLSLRHPQFGSAMREYIKALSVDL